jgi:hypothetical protein
MAAGNADMALDATEVLRLHVEIGEPKRIGDTGAGLLTILPIIGGSFSGDGVCGRVLPGGADWNTRLGGGVSHVLARYWIETDDGVVISVENEGYYNETCRDAVIRTTPRFRCDVNGAYAFLTKDVFAAELNGAGDNAVNIVVYKLL